MPTAPAVRLSLADLPDAWRSVLQWGHCLCPALDGETCPSCSNAQRIEAAGLDWLSEYGKAIQAGKLSCFSAAARLRLDQQFSQGRLQALRLSNTEQRP